MKQFLPDQDGSSLRHTRAFPPSVSVNSNHAGIHVRMFRKWLYVFSLNTAKKNVCVHHRSANRLWYSRHEVCMEMQDVFLCLDKRWIRVQGVIGWGKKQTEMLETFNQWNLVRAQAKMIPALSQACCIELPIPSHSLHCVLPSGPGQASQRGHIETPKEEASVNKIED